MVFPLSHISAVTIGRLWHRGLLWIKAGGLLALPSLQLSSQMPNNYFCVTFEALNQWPQPTIPQHHCPWPASPITVPPLAGPNTMSPHTCWPHHCSPHLAGPITVVPTSASPSLCPPHLPDPITVSPTPGQPHHCAPSTASFSTCIPTHALLHWHYLPLKIFSISWSLRKMSPSQIPSSGSALAPSFEHRQYFSFKKKKNS